jgi:hypothetical protein
MFIYFAHTIGVRGLDEEVMQWWYNSRISEASSVMFKILFFSRKDVMWFWVQTCVLLEAKAWWTQFSYPVLSSHWNFSSSEYLFYIVISTLPWHDIRICQEALLCYFSFPKWKICLCLVWTFMYKHSVSKPISYLIPLSMSNYRALLIVCYRKNVASSPI